MSASSTQRVLALFAVTATLIHGSTATGAVEPAGAVQPPNIVVVFADDLGYADIGCFGAKGYTTPNIDRLATEGIRFTDFYVPQAVCSASRTALLTGCYPNRVGILGALGPASKIGIAEGESTIAEVLKRRDYATAIYGKWHLGHHDKFLPTRHGFDQYFGLPYSNDMWPKHPTNKSFPDLPLIEGEKVIATNPDQKNLTTWYADRAVGFIKENKDRPFFLYLAHSMPHVPLHVSDKESGRTSRGLFGDVIEAIDGSVGRILATLEEQGLDQKTLVVFTSDNGPWLSYGNHAGSAGPFREGKGTSFEGGIREPFVARWPGKIPAGSICREPAMTIDLLPTFAELAGADRSGDRPIDGRTITPLLLAQPDAKSPHEAFPFYWGQELQAIRSGRWKLHFPHKYRSLAGAPGADGKPAPYQDREIGLSLYDLQSDPGEQSDLATQHPEVVERLSRLADAAREDLGDSATNRQGKNVRPAGKL
ncbi:sulfatase family protein [Singulisphaera acidiphila]|uniref:Arylsulfatase A family protein n=1 Tax=Singulisphaera acidiphila (strain ATCC BAA-1392 / DSM 18658 / VKM B-2454 / MOB10) TaxID=886293 RepID=L0DL24_SINAD|nr:sulfatase [Singulisphaera acidiphila]AGA29558.1 arylsulfatase A family protein [Singulisphaera acidiphila DSM 18658]